MEEIDPIRSKFLQQLKELSKRKSKIAYDNTLSLEAKTCQIQNLSLNDSATEPAVRLEDLAITFTYLPSSRVFGFQSAELIKNGSDIEVSVVALTCVQGLRCKLPNICCFIETVFISLQSFKKILYFQRGFC